MFLFVTAEEKGLLGSEYYAQHPLYPLETTAAVYNIDGGSDGAVAATSAVAGDGKISLQDDLAAGAQRQGAQSLARSAPRSGLVLPIGSLPFRQGRRAGHLVPRRARICVEGGVAAGKAAADEYNAKHYHQPSDEWSASWDLRGAVIDIGLLYTIGRDMANSRTLARSGRTGRSSRRSGQDAAARR